MTRQKWIILLLIIGTILLLFLVGSLISLNIFYGIFHKGNRAQYNVKKTQTLKASPIKGNLYYFLGSSVTFGSASYNESMADFIEKRNDCIVVKDAVSGTFLANSGKSSYVERLSSFDVVKTPHAFICQLSTNDTRYDKKGVISDSFTKEDFDKTTTYGAIEYIIAYAKETWDCPIIFYTNSYYDNEDYGNMVNAMKSIAIKWNIILIDLFSNDSFNAISDIERKLYMNDQVHPTRAGYKLWWTAEFESVLYNLQNGEK